MWCELFVREITSVNQATFEMDVTMMQKCLNMFQKVSNNLKQFQTAKTPMFQTVSNMFPKRLKSFQT